MVDLENVYFRCDECPIAEDVEHRLCMSKKYGFDFQPEYCGCDKVGSAFYIGGYCGDAFSRKVAESLYGTRKTGASYRRKMRSRKREKLMRSIDAGYARDIYDKKDGKYIAFPKNSKYKKYYRTFSNRLFRRGKDGGSGKGDYRRCFDYKWEIY